MEAEYEVSVAMDGVTGYEMIMANPPDLILLDVMLPGMNGIELCRRVRNQRLSVPIIMLTALGSSENVVTGLEIGADDYVIKPFEFSELLARISAVSRRSNGRNEIYDAFTLSIDDLTVDTRGKIAIRAGEKISLTATEYNLLEFLVRNKGKVFSRMEILDRVWGINFDTSTNVVDVYINYLRRKVDKKSSKKLIHTVVGLGYVLREENDQ